MSQSSDRVYLRVLFCWPILTLGIKIYTHSLCLVYSSTWSFEWKENDALNVSTTVNKIEYFESALKKGITTRLCLWWIWIWTSIRAQALHFVWRATTRHLMWRVHDQKQPVTMVTHVGLHCMDWKPWKQCISCCWTWPLTFTPYQVLPSCPFWHSAGKLKLLRTSRMCKF